MSNISHTERKFLFLQGPHGPFQYLLAKQIAARGASIRKICFNAGDVFFWRSKQARQSFTEPMANWPEYLSAILDQGITDIVLYGDHRPVHVEAAQQAKARGITLHFLEEGYLRPYWATYERTGVNGNSPVMQMSVAEMRQGLRHVDMMQPAAPVLWGDMRQHILLGAIYHWHVMFSNKKFPNYTSHRATPVKGELRLHLRKMFNRLPHAIERRLQTNALIKSGVVYHLGVLQLSHDASVQKYSSYADMPAFMRETIAAFARGAPKHHHIVFKAHPLEDEQKPLGAVAQDLADEFGVSGRVHYIRGGKLARILNYAHSVITINSTAAQQALWRGLPVKALGISVYDKPEFTSNQSLEAFFGAPKKPDLAAYRDYRQYLLATSQIPGGYYSRENRVRLLLQLVDLILNRDTTYDILTKTSAAPVQQSHLGKT